MYFTTSTLSSIAISYYVNGTLKGDRIDAASGFISLNGIIPNGANTAKFYITGSSNSSRWANGTNSISLINFIVDINSSAAAAPGPKPWILWAGDGVFEGYETDFSLPTG
jgi:hypothetical protein